MSAPTRARVAAVVGPTAVGKTEVSVRVAERVGAEIVSVDSMQIYRGMDVGTAKPSAEARARVPHHLLDLRDPDHVLTVQEFQGLARAAIADVSARGRLPLLVGGSGLYFRAVVDELNFPPRAPEVRAALTAEAERVGPGALYDRLRAADPTAAAKIEPGNARRIVRALEVIELTGRPFSENDGWERYESTYELEIAGLGRSRDDLYDRIARRVRTMIAHGLFEEIARLEAAGMGATARQALGYRQVLEASPDATRDEIADAIAGATKRFARRQESWFRADPRVRWFEASRPDVADALVDYFRASLRLP